MVDFALLADHRIKQKECEKEISTSTLLENWKKNIEHEGDNYAKWDWWFMHGN